MLPGVGKPPGEEGGHDLGKFVGLEHFNIVRTKRSDFPRTSGGCARGTARQMRERKSRVKENFLDSKLMQSSLT